MKNKLQVIQKLISLEISAVVKKDGVVIKSSSHHNLLKALKWVDKSKNLYCLVNKGIIQIRFTK